MKQITSFWSHFKNNEQQILYAVLFGYKTEEVFDLLFKNLNGISKKIDFLFKRPSEDNDKFIIIFSGKGNPKLFDKIMAIENQAPELKHFIAQAFIKPLENPTIYKDGTDKPCWCRNFEIKISEIQMTLLDYNSATQQLKINLYLPDYDKLKNYEGVKEDINWIVMGIIGEIAYFKNIKEINLYPIPAEPFGLISLLDLTEYITYLHTANQFKKENQINFSVPKTDNRKPKTNDPQHKTHHRKPQQTNHHLLELLQKKTNKK
jgi:hypothetical protein